MNIYNKYVFLKLNTNKNKNIQNNFVIWFFWMNKLEFLFIVMYSHFNTKKLVNIIIKSFSLIWIFIFKLYNIIIFIYKKTPRKDLEVCFLLK